METWILVMYVYAGIWAKGDSVALATVTDFSSKPRCEDAGKQLAPLVRDTTKDVRFVCLRK